MWYWIARQSVQGEQSKGFRDGLIMAAAGAGPFRAAHLIVDARDWIGGREFNAVAGAGSLGEQKEQGG